MTSIIWTENIADIIHSPRITQLLKTSFNNFFAHPAYVAANENDTQVPVYFIYKDGESIYFKCFLKNTISDCPYFDITNAYGFGGSLSNTDDRIFNADALSAFIDTARSHNIIAETIKFNPFENKDLSAYYGEHYSLHKMRDVVSVDLQPDNDYRFSNIYTHANRKNIKKAIKSNFSHVIESDDFTWKSFLDLYSNTMKNNNASDFYFFPERYFLKIRTLLPNFHFLLSIKDGHKIIACLLVFYDTRQAYCHLLGNDPHYFKYGINNYIYDLAIKECKKRDLSQLLLGGGRTNASDDPLLKFKMNFSSQLLEFWVGESIFNEPAYMELCKNKGVEAYASGNLFSYRT